MVATQLHECDSLDLHARIAALEERDRLMSDRIEKLEHLHGISVDKNIRWLTVKAAHYESGYSESGIRKLIRESRVTHEWRGGKVYVSDVPTRR
jgi:hypothetical protein